MPVNSTVPTSRRLYLSEDELEQFADITVTDATEGADRISQAEEAVDAYVGFHEKFMNDLVFGIASAATNTTITLESTHVNVYDTDFFKYCEVEIVSGTGEGQRRTITGSTRAGVLTVQSAWTVNPNTTSYYKIYQLGKFPRYCDCDFHNTTLKWVKRIPEQVKRAVAAQVQYQIEVGDSFLSGDKTDLQREQIGDYEYELSQGSTSSMSRQLSPKGRMLLNGITNRKGKILI
jgi:hypothetical protein